MIGFIIIGISLLVWSLIYILDVIEKGFSQARKERELYWNGAWGDKWAFVYGKWGKIEKEDKVDILDVHLNYFPKVLSSAEVKRLYRKDN